MSRLFDCHIPLSSRGFVSKFPIATSILVISLLIFLFLLFAKSNIPDLRRRYQKFSPLGGPLCFSTNYRPSHSKTASHTMRSRAVLLIGEIAHCRAEWEDFASWVTLKACMCSGTQRAFCLSHLSPSSLSNFHFPYSMSFVQKKQKKDTLCHALLLWSMQPFCDTGAFARLGPHARAQLV